jgi:TorA maturation chaperone TorD
MTDVAVADAIRALAGLSEPPEPEHARVAASLGLPGVPTGEAYVKLFVLQAYPYASVYLGPEGMLGGEARDRIAGFWRALGLVPPPEPDHLAALLGLYAALIEAEAGEPDPARAALRRSARAALLWEHLLSWCPIWLEKVSAIASPTYRSWADLLGSALVEEARHVGPQERLPLALREAPGLPGADAAADDLVAAILAPVRSGFIVTRADLARCAHELGMGLRMGERSYILRALLEQGPEATLGWLADESAAAAARYRSLPPALEDVVAAWRGRAERTASSLGEGVGAGIGAGAGAA